MPTDRTIHAPWTTRQVEALNAWQQRDDVHPFTCPGTAHAGSGTHVVLVAREDGWHCPGCGYWQSWAHDFMAEEAPDGR